MFQVSGSRLTARKHAADHTTSAGAAPTPPLPIPSIFPAHTPAIVSEVERKITQVKTINTKVAHLRTSAGSRDDHGSAIRSRISKIPCASPQSANVQFAPCHRPPRSIVTRRFQYVRTV